MGSRSGARTLKAKVYVTLKPSLLDAQGKTLMHALRSLGFAVVTDVRVGKYLELMLASRSRRAAQQEVERMCQKLLANPVIETYRFEFNSSR